MRGSPYGGPLLSQKPDGREMNLRKHVRHSDISSKFDVVIVIPTRIRSDSTVVNNCDLLHSRYSSI